MNRVDEFDAFQSIKMLQIEIRSMPIGQFTVGRNFKHQLLG
jgi:hypothetical protein